MNIDIKLEVNKILLKKLKIEKKLDSNTNLISNGFLDSFNILHLILELEKNFKLKINLKKFNIKNFETKKKIISFVKKNTN
jgi:acyl carrier protein